MDRETMTTRNTHSGFTLIELIIAVAIIGILSAIAIPSYFQYIEKTRRTAARTVLSELASRQESYFADRKQYAATGSLLNYPADTFYVDGEGNISASAGSDAAYVISINRPNNFTYTATATATGVQVDDDDCDKFTIDNAGARLAYDSGGSATTNCW